MRQSSSLFVRVWFVIPLLALGFTAWVDWRNIQRLERIATLTRGESVPQSASWTGYAGGIRERVLTDHEGRSYEWLAQTQRMLAHGEWRIREIDWENAPLSRPTHAASPYRWWLGLVAGLNRLLTGNSAGIAVERASLYADPLLHGLSLFGLTWLAFQCAGPLAASLAAFGGAVLFPFAAGFLPGVLDDTALKPLCVFGSLLPLLAGWREPVATAGPKIGLTRTKRWWFSVAGISGGLGLWLSPASQTPLLVGIALGAVLGAWVRRRGDPGPRNYSPALPWRYWSGSGAGVVFVASLIEYFPQHLGGWEVRALHPLYGVAWIGGGELLARLTGWIETGVLSREIGDLLGVLLALLAVGSVPLVMVMTDNPGFLVADLLSLRLTPQPDAALFANLGAWLKADGLSSRLVATLLPLLLLVPALAMAFRRQTPRVQHSGLVLILGALGPALVLGYFQLGSWVLLDAQLLVLLIALIAAFGEGAKAQAWLWVAGTLALLAPGAARLVPVDNAPADNALSVSEAIGLAERDLAHWLARRAGADTPPIVHAPPQLTTALAYYGGLRGIGTLSWENPEGLAFAIRTAISISRDETAALLRRRQVNYIVVPSWDGFFDDYLRGASVQSGEMFYQGLERWSLPPWLRPIPYRLPTIPGFEKQSVRIFEVVDDQDPPAAASRLTEYFIEQGDWTRAKISHQALLKYPGDFGAMIARAQLWAALKDADAFAPVFEALLDRLAVGADRHLLWDRRVSLAVVLARGNRLDLARGQIERCFAEAGEVRLRSLTTEALYHLLVLGKTLDLKIADPHLRQLAGDLLPAGLRQDL